jgi:hypothetical protein
VKLDLNLIKLLFKQNGKRMQFKRIITLTALAVVFSNTIFSQVGIGTITPHASAELDVTSTTKGFLVPRMTQVQRNAIAIPVVAGLQIWCSNCGTSGEMQVYNGTTWTNMIGGVAGASVPDAPTSPVAAAGNTQSTITFSAPASNGGSAITGYTVTSSPGSFTATGATSPIIVTGLTNGTSYTFTIVATNALGNSVASVVSNAVTPNFVCGSTVTFTYNGSSVTYGTVSRVYGAPVGTKCWLDRNLGATQVATSNNDAASYGDLFQWGRGADLHQLITRTNATTASAVNGITTTLSPSDSPGNALFITINSGTWDWRSPQNDSLWQGVSGINNPCPSGFRLPTGSEIEAERSSWGVNNNANGAINSPLKLPLAGFRNHNGPVIQVGTYGYYWSSQISGVTSLHLTFEISSATAIYSLYRARGASVRCIKN